MIAGQLEIQLMANMARLSKDMNEAKSIVTTNTRAIESAVASVKAALASIGLGVGLAGIIALTDQYTKYTAQLKLATLSTREFAQAQMDVRRIATAAQTDLAAVGVLYARITNSTREMGLSQERVTRLTETIALSLKASGATAQESASAMLQLSQAFASGVLRGEEFNAVNEAAPRLMKALAEGMGVPIGALREMAKEGKITSEIMANAIPRALEEVRKEAAQVQTIAGAWQVLKNNLMEFVGATNTSNGMVAVLTSAIGFLASNLNALIILVTTIMVAKFGQWFYDTATAVYTKVTALVASAAATKKEAEANVAAAASDVARLQTTLAFVAADREKAIAELQAANATIQATAAVGAHTAALRMNTEAKILASAATAELAALGRLQATTTAQLTAATAAQAAAQTALAATGTAASVATTMLSRAVGFLGGPIGAIVTILGLAATAWALFGTSSQEANKKAVDSTTVSSIEIIREVDRQNEKLRERLVLMKAVGDIAKTDSPATQEAARLQSVVNTLMQKQMDLKAQGVRLSREDQFELDFARQKLAEIVMKLQQQNTIKKDIERGNPKAAEWLEKYATNAEKLAAELAKAKKELGEGFTPDLEKRIREKYADRDKEAKKAAREQETLNKAYDRENQLLDEKIGLLEQELGIGRKLTEGEKLLVKIQEGKYEKFTPLEQAELERKAQLLDKLNSEVRARKYAREMIEAQTAAQEEYDNALAQNLTQGTQSIKNLIETNEQLQIELSGITKTTLARKLDNLELEKKRLLSKTMDEGQRESIELEYKKRAALLQSVDTMEKQVTMFNQLADLAGGFATALMDGVGSAFDYLKKQAKSFLAELISIFAKRWILNMMGQGDLAAQQGQGSLAGSVMNMFSQNSSSIGNWASSIFGGGASGLDPYEVDMMAGSVSGGGSQSWWGGSQGASGLGTAAAGALGGLGASALLRATGTGPRGQQIGTSLGSAGASIGMMVGGPIGAAIGALAGAVIGHFSDPDGLAQRTAQVGRSSDGQYNYGQTSAFGSFGVFDDKWFSDSEMGGPIKDFLKGVKGFEDSLAKYLSKDEIERVTKALSGSKEFGFGEEHADFAHAFGAILQDRVKTIVGAIDPMFVKLIDGFEGTGEEMSAFVLDMFKAREMLKGNPIEGLDMEKLIALKKEGETVGQTLTRVAAVFASTSKMIDSAFGAVGIATYEAREQLIEFAGGLEAFNAAQKSFYDNFYSKEEKELALRKQLSDEFDKHNLQLPLTRAEYRALVEAQDLSTEEGRKMYAFLITLAPAFAELVPAIENVGKAVEETVKKIDAISIGQIQDWASQQMAALQSRITTLFSGTGIEQRTAGSLNIIDADIQRYQNQLAQAFLQSGGVGNATTMGLQQLIQMLQQQRQSLTADLARYVILNAQHPGKGEALMELEKWYNEMRGLFANNSAALLEIEKLYAKKREDIIAGAGQETANKLADYLRGSLLNEQLSPLTLQQRFGVAQTEFQRLLALAQSGDQNAINGLGSARDALLELGRQMFGSSGNFNALWTTTFDQIKALAGAGAPSWQTSFQSALPPTGQTMASDAGLKRIEEAVNNLIGLIAAGITVTDPEAQDALQGINENFRATEKAPL